MNVYGVGPPRSGTTMLARCLSVVNETHHECRDAFNADARRVNRRSWTRQPVTDAEVAAIVPHPNEVAFWLCFVSERLNGKVIHLWRPAEVWVRSAVAFGLMRPERRRIWDGDLPQISIPDGTQVEQLLWVYREMHSRVLEERPDAYITTPDRIVWTDLFKWLGWGATSEQVRRAQATQRVRPNRGNPWDGVVVVDDETREVESALEARTPFTREQAVHRL
jgi:hypothetical protein